MLKHIHLLLFTLAFSAFLMAMEPSPALLKAVVSVFSTNQSAMVELLNSLSTAETKKCTLQKVYINSNLIIFINGATKQVTLSLLAGIIENVTMSFEDFMKFLARIKKRSQSSTTTCELVG